jgi:hypothetical protein
MTNSKAIDLELEYHNACKISNNVIVPEHLERKMCCVLRIPISEYFSRVTKCLSYQHEVGQIILDTKRNTDMS